MDKALAKQKEVRPPESGIRHFESMTLEQAKAEAERQMAAQRKKSGRVKRSKAKKK